MASIVKRDECMVFVTNSEVKRQLLRPKLRLEDNIRIDLKTNRMGGWWPHSYGSG